MLASLISFGRSFRVGIDVDRPDKLVTTGIFAWSRNPIYVALFLVLAGQFLVFPNWVPLVYLFAGTWLFHRQVLREESSCGGSTATNTRRIADVSRRYVYTTALG